MRRLLTLCLICLLPLIAVTACSGKGEEAPAVSTDQTEAERSRVAAEKLYNEATELLGKENFLEAAAKFDTIDREYPYSPFATRAQLMSGYAHYKRMKYDEAVLSLDRFIELHPAHEDIAYAYYLRALCYYEQIVDVRRDQRMTQLALENLRQIVDRFPESKYAKDAALKLDLTTDHLAGKEMEIGRYYLLRGQFQAALPRFKRVIEQYQTTSHVPEALHRMTEAYLSLGLLDEAKKSAAILGHNYPESSWYRDTYMLMGGTLPAEDMPQKQSVYDRTLGKLFN